jgi:hypothetical protein
VHGGGPSAGLALLAIFVLEESEGSMLGSDEERPAKSHWFVLEVMIVVFGRPAHVHVLPVENVWSAAIYLLRSLLLSSDIGVCQSVLAGDEVD